MIKQQQKIIKDLKSVAKLLKQVKEFPEDLVKEVKRLIISVEKGYLN